MRLEKKCSCFLAQLIPPESQNPAIADLVLHSTHYRASHRYQYLALIDQFPIWKQLVLKYAIVQQYLLGINLPFFLVIEDVLQNPYQHPFIYTISPGDRIRLVHLLNLYHFFWLRKRMGLLQLRNHSLRYDSDLNFPYKYRIGMNDRNRINRKISFAQQVRADGYHWFAA